MFLDVSLFSLFSQCLSMSRCPRFVFLLVDGLRLVWVGARANGHWGGHGVHRRARRGVVGRYVVYLCTRKDSGTVFNSRLMSSIAFFSPLCSPFFFLLFALSLSLLVFSLGWHSWFCFSCFSLFLFQTSWICVGTATVLEVSTRFRTRRYRWGLRWVLCSGLGFNTRWKRILPKYVAKRVLEGGG